MVNLAISFPVIIHRGRGGKIVAALMNMETYDISIKSDTLWLLHPQDSTIIHYRGRPELYSLSKSAGWFEAVIDANSLPSPYLWSKEESAAPGAAVPSKNSSKMPAKRSFIELDKHWKELLENKINKFLAQQDDTLEQETMKLKSQLTKAAMSLAAANDKASSTKASAQVLSILMSLGINEKISPSDLLAELEAVLLNKVLTL